MSAKSYESRVTRVKVMSKDKVGPDHGIETDAHPVCCECRGLMVKVAIMSDVKKLVPISSELQEV